MGQFVAQDGAAKGRRRRITVRSEINIRLVGDRKSVHGSSKLVGLCIPMDPHAAEIAAESVFHQPARCGVQRFAARLRVALQQSMALGTLRALTAGLRAIAAIAAALQDAAAISPATFREAKRRSAIGAKHHAGAPSSACSKKLVRLCALFEPGAWSGASLPPRSKSCLANWAKVS